MQETTPQAPKTKVASDSLFSTYWWKINLDRTMPINKVNTITGYSKFRDHNEAKDKHYLLMKSVVLMAKYQKPTYLERSISIEFYKRVGNIINKEADELLFTLFKDQYIIHPKYIGDTEMQLFLTKFYQALKQGHDIQGLMPRPKVRQPGEVDDMINVGKVTIHSATALQNYCSKLIHSGFNFAEVKHFYEKYLEKMNW